MLTIACVLRSGGIYKSKWVERLWCRVVQNLDVPCSFVCLTDDPPTLGPRWLEHNWPAWWSKMELFKIPGPVLYFDLDTAIVGDISDLAKAAQEHDFIALRDFYRPNGLGSGVMAWKGDMSHVYQAFLKNPEGWMQQCAFRGDQGFIELCCPNATRWQDILPGQIVSYKADCIEGIPKDARVVCLHGKPKFEDIPEDDPVRKVWEAA